MLFRSRTRLGQVSFLFDHFVLTPGDVDLARSPLAGRIDADTYVLGAFNPGMTRHASGNLLLMVRIAEALREPIRDRHIHAIRWRSEEHTSEIQSLLRNSYAVFCLEKNNRVQLQIHTQP